MRRVSRLAIIPAAVVLAATAAAPVAAVDPPPSASIQIAFDVAGYVTPDMPGVNVGIWCNTWGDEPQYFDFELYWPADPSWSEPIDVPADSVCDVVDFSGADSKLGYWTDWLDEPGGPFAVPAGEPVVVTITTERVYNGNEPWPDESRWFELDAFTIDRVFINRYGGVTAEGTLLCSSLAELYGIEPGKGEPPALGVNWTATQYVGRKTAIHGSYSSDIANFCIDPEDPGAPQPWRSMHPGTGEAVTAWVYGENGKFASGSIRIDAAVDDQSTYVLQWWDPSGESGEFDPVRCGQLPVFEFFDSNSDGFCTIEVFVGQRTTANLRTIRAR